jgi:cyclophilin family peptidyl-prolyl cis-trans isomerase
MIKQRWAAVSLTAAFILSACDAQPANVPTSTPVQATPTPGNILPTATPSAVPQSANMSVAPSGGRIFSTLTPAQRSKIGNAPPVMTIDATKKYIATIKTSKGEIVVELDPSAAPQTVNNFIFLSNNGFYDGLVFHRVEPGFVIQGGDPSGNGTGGPGYTLPPEIKLKHVEGAIAMARRGGPPETTPSSGSQFYITLAATPNLDGGYTSFGKTINGMEVAKQIAIGDKITRIDIVAADGGAVAVAKQAETKPATCAVLPLNVGADERIFGNKDAVVTLIEYGDFQCPGCASLHPQIKTVMNAVSDTLRLVFRHYPLPIHDKAVVAARGAEAAALQGKFWEMQDLLYTKQSEWEKKPAAEISATLKAFAKELKLNEQKFETDLASAAVAARVERDAKSGNAMKVSGTPSLFIDGRPLPLEAFSSPTIISDVKTYIGEASKRVSSANKKTFNFEKAETVIESGANYVMTVKTTKGDIVIDLDTKSAPVNVNSVAFLAQKEYYNNTPIFNNFPDPGVVLLGTSTLQGNPGYDCETEPGGTFDTPGKVALNLSTESRNTMQLVFVYNPAAQLSGRFTVIGTISQGLEIAKSLKGPEGDTKADSIVSVTVSKK